MGKSSAHSSKRRRSKGWTGYLFSFLLGSLLTFLGYSYLIREKPLSSEAFLQKVFLIDQILRSQLYEADIPKKDILSQQSPVKKEKGVAWKQSTFKIQLPRSLSFSTIEDHLRQSLSALGKPVSIQSTQGSESLQLEVKVMGRTTHQLTFLYSRPLALKPELRARVAIVIDDLGGEEHISEELLHWDLPITLSILPFTRRAKTLALEAHRRGREVILHLPMEPNGYPKIRPGEGVLLQEMDKERLLHQLSEDIEAVPYIKGVSSHMGSRLTEDPEKMEIILSELKRRGLYFLDSRTSPQAVGIKTARSLGLKAAERTIFLDNSSGEGDVKQKLEELTRLSLAKGKAIGIGHPHSSTIKSLKEMIPKMKERGIDIVPLSSMME
jgi:polysaccharide deacetylase 2 family uncharacterized protein YibQ